MSIFTSLKKTESLETHPKKSIRFYSIGTAIVLFVLANLWALLSENHFLFLSLYRQRAQTEKVYLYRELPQQDILYMGNSVAGFGIIPSVTEQTLLKQTGIKLKTLNLGMSAMTSDYNYLFLKNIIEDNRKPSIIVYTMFDTEFLQTTNKYDRLNQNSESWIMSRPDDFGIFSGENPLQQADFLLRQFVPLYRNRSLILNNLNMEYNPADPLYANYSPGPQRATPNWTGYNEFPDKSTIDPEVLKQQLEVPLQHLKTITPDSFSTTDLERFLQLAKDRGIKVVLLNVPVSDEYRAAWPTPELMQKYLTLLKAVSTRYNVPLLDLYENKSRTFTPSDFFDNLHVTRSGAEKTSVLLAKELLAPLVKTQVVQQVDYQSNLSGLVISPRLPNNSTIHASLEVTNLGNNIWPINGKNAVFLAYHWLDEKGNVVKFDGMRSALPRVIPPKEHQQVDFIIQTPLKPGNYILEADLIHEGITWFGSKGNPTIKKPIIILDRSQF